MYQGIEIADYILNYAEQCNYQITNLRLQKILYYIQLNFLKQYDHVIFEDDILAMRHGPCIQSVFHEPTGKPVGLIFKINLIGTTCKTDRISLALSE